MQIKPRNGYVTVKLLEGELVSKGGIVMPQNAQQRNHVVTIVGVGGGDDDKDLEAGQLAVATTLSLEDKIGDVYLIDSYSLTAIYEE